MLLVGVEQEVKENEQQESAAEGRHFGMVGGQMARVLGRGVERHVPDIDQAEAGGGGDDYQREQQAHAEHGHQDPDREEQLTPERVPGAQNGGVDDRVVERERHFQDAQHGGDPDRLEQSGYAALRV